MTGLRLKMSYVRIGTYFFKVYIMKDTDEIPYPFLII